MPIAVLSNNMGIGERFAYAGRMLLVGMGAIFVALALLWGALALFRVVMSATATGKKKKAPVIVLEQTPPAEAVTPVIVKNNDDEIVAAITAAVAATLAEENGGVPTGFRVVSFRRADQKK